MKQNFSNLTSVYIHPGEVCFSRNTIVVSTVLGSCLSITMFSRREKYAAISHCQLPYNKNCASNCNNCNEPFKYVKCTIIRMLKRFEELKIHRSDIEVKIFGGADVLNTSPGRNKFSTVGRQNIQIALETLANYNISASVTDVGGEVGRKIFFLTETGDIFLSRLKPNEQN